MTDTERQILSNFTASQIDTHKLYGGVVPEIASRAHIEAISNLTYSAIEESGISVSDIDLIGVTAYPGLIGRSACRSKLCQKPRICKQYSARCRKSYACTCCCCVFYISGVKTAVYSIDRLRRTHINFRRDFLYRIQFNRKNA